MANEGQYINPIIEAMVHTAQNAKDAQELSERTRANKANEAYRQSQLAQQESQFEKDLEIKHRQADLYSSQIKDLLEHSQIDKIKELHGLKIGGVDIGAIFGQQGQGGEGANASYAAQPQIPTVTNPGAGSGKVAIPGVGDINPDALGSPAQQFDLARKQAEATASGTAAGQLPTKLTELTEEGKIRKNLQNAEIVSKEKVDFFNRVSAEKIAQWNNAARIKAAGMGLTNIDPMDNTVNDIYITGNRTLPAGKFGLAIEGAVPKGWTPLSKTDNILFDNVTTANKIIQDARTLAAAGINNPGQALQGALGMGEVGATKNRVEGLLGNLARYFGQERGVMTEKDIDRAKKLVYSPRLSEAGNLKNVGELETLLNSKIALVTKKYPKDQLTAIMAARGLDASKFTGDAKSSESQKQYFRNSIGHRIYSEDGGQTFKDAITNQPVSQ